MWIQPSKTTAFVTGILVIVVEKAFGWVHTHHLGQWDQRLVDSSIVSTVLFAGAAAIFVLGPRSAFPFPLSSDDWVELRQVLGRVFLFFVAVVVTAVTWKLFE